jgi:hypothetical protein
MSTLLQVNAKKIMKEMHFLNVFKTLLNLVMIINVPIVAQIAGTMSNLA